MAEAVADKDAPLSPEEQIARARKKWDQVAIENRPKVVSFHTAVALFTPFAVLLLAIQIMVFPHQNAASLILIALELALLLFVLLTGFASLGPSPQRWLLPRLRCEILRREEFLLMARVGPYLKCGNEAAVATAVKLRLDALNTESNNPMDYLALEGHVGNSWRDEFEDLGPGQSTSLGSDCCDRYQRERILEEREWFHRKSELLAGADALWEGWAKAILACALVVAAMHLIALVSALPGPAGGERPLLQLVLEVAAISLPALGSAASVVQVLMQARHVSRGYQEQARLLDVIDGRLGALVQEQAEATSEEERSRLAFKLRRLVLTTEGLLSEELRHWYLLMAPSS
jgi:hypothetical protein